MQANEVLGFIEENDVKFIRLAFTDAFGQLKNIAILPDQLSAAFEEGIAIDATAVEGYEGVVDEDLLLCPDPSTLCILPWRPQAGRVCRLLCELVKPNGEQFASGSRAILRRSSQNAKAAGFDVRIATDCEFYLFDLDERGKLTMQTHDEAGYMDVAPLDRCEDVRRDICLMLEQMDIRPECSHHERGPGQNGVDFHRADPMTAADHYVAFIHAVRSVALRYGVHATFVPKPITDQIGNGLHVNLSFYQDGNNLFRMTDGVLGETAQAMMAGILRRLPEITLLLNPLPNSYNRLKSDNAFSLHCWSMKRDRACMRIPLPQSRFARMQLSSPDPTMNVYIGFALLIEAALEGLRDGASLKDFKDASDEDIQKLPQSLEHAIALAKDSAFIAKVLPGGLLEQYVQRAHSMLGEYERDARVFNRKQIMRF